MLRSDFERFSSEEVERLRRLAAASSSPATRRAYTRHWRDFTRWCEGRGVQPLPASPETCALFLSSMAERGLKVATIEQAMAAVSKAHRAADLPSPRTEAVRAVLGGIRRTLGIAQKQAAPATAVDLRAMVAALPSTLIGKRDAAMLLVGFAGAFRRSELVALTRA
ncbi:MAG: phage integrase N-terminal SAM-like domain-containing protein, partial [Myxococcales bacterium]|nr:phage integrase N-terminal SAM-like domain-containing protein [Myxococcales bacterium]